MRIESATSTDDKGYVLSPEMDKLRVSNHIENPVQCEQRLLREHVREQQQQEQQQRCAGSLRMSEIDEYVTLEEVELAYYECRKNKRNSEGALKYEMHYEANNYRLWQELNAETYEIGYSVCFCVTRPKLREVFAADFRDRIVHHIIMRKFLAMFESEMIEDSYNCRKGKGVMYAVNKVQQYITEVSEGYTKETWVLKCDLQGFFMSIDRDVLWHMIKELVVKNYDGSDKEWWLRLINKVVYHRPEMRCNKHGDLTLWDRLEKHKSLFCSNGKGLPIGNLTSQIFANYYMTKFDRWILSDIGKDSRYGRFVDDFVIISRDKNMLLNMLSEIRNWLKDVLHVTLHPNKFYLQEVNKGVEFVGTIIKNGRRYSTNRTVNNAFEVVRLYNEGRICASELSRRYNSYMGFLVHNNTYGIRWRIWESVMNKSPLCNVGMKKIVIIKDNKRLEQTDEGGILTAVWTDIKNEDYEFCNNNNQC